MKNRKGQTVIAELAIFLAATMGVFYTISLTPLAKNKITADTFKAKPKTVDTVANPAPILPDLGG